jgi:peptidoglycan/LPS O-acetylase OafA/YrhL
MGAIRLFLALVVVVSHCQFMFFDPVGINIPIYFELGMNAGFAVMFFYMISGFLMSLTLNTKYPATPGGTIKFYQSRFIRIFSLYWPMVVLVFIFVMPMHDWLSSAPWQDKIPNLFLLGMDARLAFADYPGSHWDAALPLLHQSWSLDAELTFYILAPFVLRSMRLSIGLLIASALCRIAMYQINGGFSVAWTYYFLPSTILFFLLGHFAYIFKRFLENGKIGPILLGVCAIALLKPHGAPWDSFRFWLAVLCFAGSLPGIFRATAQIRWMNALGNLSYPVYLTHLFALSELDAFFGHKWMTEPSVAILLIGFVLVCAIGVHWLLEKPAAFALRSLVVAADRLVRASAVIRNRVTVNDVVIVARASGD